jgi:predicted ATP-dependent endonuclease of OLD family
MAIKSIELKNFTVFEHLKCDFTSGLNIFIGENGTGKTHLLKVLYAFCIASARDSNLLHELRPLFNSNPFVKGILNRSVDNDIEMQIDLDGIKYDYFLSISNDKTGYSCHGSQVNEELFSTFIPAKEMLSISNITRIDERFDKELAIDKSLVNIIKKAQSMKLSNPSELAKKVIPKLERIIGGTVFIKENDNTFWIRKINGEEILFAMEAEGIRKFGLLWQLLMNGSLIHGSILFWDEPEANLNPALIPVIVDILLDLSRNGVQIFLSTHDYLFAKYFEVRRIDSDLIRFHSLYKTDNNIMYEHNENFRDLNENPIIAAYDDLLDEVIRLNIGD